MTLCKVFSTVLCPYTERLKNVSLLLTVDVHSEVLCTPKEKKKRERERSITSARQWISFTPCFVLENTASPGGRD